jgi:hypothetical protein
VRASPPQWWCPTINENRLSQLFGGLQRTLMALGFPLSSVAGWFLKNFNKPTTAIQTLFLPRQFLTANR